MSKPVIRSGKFTAGAFLQCGENVIVDVAEEVIVGDRCVLADGTYLGGRRITLADDFFGYAALDVGHGRRDHEDAILNVGSRCTFHNSRFDLARHIAIGDDVGLSPDVVFYTHHYWLSFLEGYPCRHDPISIGNGVIVGFRSVILPGSVIGQNAVIGAQSVVTGKVTGWAVHAGNPLRKIRTITPFPSNMQQMLLTQIMREYAESCAYRNFTAVYRIDFPKVYLGGCEFDVKALTVVGEESELTDDFRDFVFRRGIRFYTSRPFRRLGIRQGEE